tara:strand:- start:585 stop:3023 length:2439 start_codon:yes stop_codon:yes gene_type:complete
MSSLGSPNPFFIAGKKAYEIERSLRFNRSDSAHLTYTPASASSDRTKVTISAWVKKCGINEGEYMIAHAGTTNNNRAQLRFYTSSGFDNISFAARVSGSWILQLDTTAKFRDPSAWYHIVARCDTTNGTANIYINGVEETSFTTSTKPSGSQSLEFFNNSEHQIGQRGYDNTGYMNGYMAEINVIQGQALDASYFGETDAITGQWNPKQYIGGYGDGFYLNFSDNSGTTATTLGKDSSGNGNNFTPYNFSVSAGEGNDSLEDTPTNNFPTINPLDGGTNALLTNGNLTFKPNSSNGGNFNVFYSTFSMRSGKWYFEVLIVNENSGTNSIQFGIGSYKYKRDSTNQNGYPGTSGLTFLNVNNSNSTYRIGVVDGSSVGSSVSTASTNDVYGIAFDADNKKVYFYKNGSAEGESSGYNVTDVGTGDFFFFSTLRYSTGGSYTGGEPTLAVNFGQRAFSYTAPTGYKKLNSANLPDPTIKLPNKHFAAFTYTGTGSSGDVVNITNSDVDFTPDWVWVKTRDVTNDHILSDSVRGGSKYLVSSETYAEQTDTDKIRAFIQNGFESGTDGDTNWSGGRPFVAWNWNAGGSTVTNNDGSVASQVRANTSAGFSIVTFSGSGNRTIGHGLGVAPQVIIMKGRNVTDQWTVGHHKLDASNPWHKGLPLNTNATTQDNATFWNDTAPTSTVFSKGSWNENYNMIAYCFSEVEGFSKFGKYEGNGNSDGTFVFTGFSPAWLMVRRIDDTDNWGIYDIARDTTNVMGSELFAAVANAEQSNSSDIDFVSNGFKFRRNYTSNNGSGTFIYLAFAESPFKYARAR